MPKVPEELLADVDWTSVFKRLVAYTYRWLGRSPRIQDAEDIAAEAIRQLLDPDYAEWDQQPESLLCKLGSVVNGLLSNRRRLKTTTHEIAHDFTMPDAGVSEASEDANPEKIAIANNLARRAIEMIEAEIKGDELAEFVWLLECDGIVDPEGQARELGVDKQAVYKARHRLGQARDRVRRRMDGDLS